MIIEAFSRLVTTAEEIADEVVISSIPPVKGDTEKQERADLVNASLNEVCDTKLRTTYITNDGNFRVADNSINDSLLHKDGIHLNLSGTKKLLLNLGLNKTYTVKTTEITAQRDHKKINTLARHTESIQMDGKLYTEIKEGARNHHDMIMTFGSLATRPHTVMDNKSTRLTRIEIEHVSRDVSVAARLVTQ